LSGLVAGPSFEGSAGGGSTTGTHLQSCSG
jgi:hypothetical protein